MMDDGREVGLRGVRRERFDGARGRGHHGITSGDGRGQRCGASLGLQQRLELRGDGVADVGGAGAAANVRGAQAAVDDAGDGGFEQGGARGLVQRVLEHHGDAEEHGDGVDGGGAGDVGGGACGGGGVRGWGGVGGQGDAPWMGS